MILVRVKKVPVEWGCDELIGQEYTAQVKDGYVTLYGDSVVDGDNLPNDHVEFIKDLDGEFTEEDFDWITETSETTTFKG